MRAFLVCLLLLLPAPSWAQSADDRRAHLAIGAYITSAFFDASITSYCHGQGRCRELNPVLAPIVERHGIVAAMTVKGAFHAGIIGILLDMHQHRPQAALWTAVGLTAAQVYVDWHNVRELRQR